MTAFEWFYSFLRKHNRKMFFGLVLVTIISILAIVKPIVSGAIVDDVITAGQYDLLPWLIALLILITIIRGVLRYWSQVIFETCSQDVLYSMRDTVYRKLLQEDFAFYNKKRTGDLLSRQTGDMDAIRHFVAFVIYHDLHGKLAAGSVHVHHPAFCRSRNIQSDKGRTSTIPAYP